MLVRVSGDNIMMSPPLTISPDEIEEVRFRLSPRYSTISFFPPNLHDIDFLL